MRGSEERTGPVRRTADSDEHRTRWLDRTPTDHVTRFGRPDRIRRTRSRRRLHRSRQHLPARSRQGGSRSRHRHRRRYAGGAREQLAPFAVQPGGRTPQRHARDAVVEYLPVSCYVETLLSYGAEAKKTQLTSQLWYKDTAGHMEATQENGGNAGLVERRRHIAGSRVVEMMGRLHVDLFMQDRFLINGVTVKIRLVRSKDAFSLMAGGVNPDYKVRIVDAVLFVRKAVLSPTVAMAHIRALEKGTAKYPLRPVDCKVYSIAQGSMSSTHENLFLGTLPKRIILWCVDNDALNGAFGKNPFHAKNNAINFLAVYVDGRQVPAKPLQPNFETGQYVRSYVNLFSATGKQGQDEGNELTRDDFGNGYTFFGFDLTPDACDGGCFHLVQKGNLRIEIHFAAPLAQTVNVVVYGESEAVLEIDKGRNIIYDH